MKALKNDKKNFLHGKRKRSRELTKIYLEGINSLLSRNSWILKL